MKFSVNLNNDGTYIASLSKIQTKIESLSFDITNLKYLQLFQFQF